MFHIFPKSDHLFATLKDICSLDSDLEVEALRKDSLYLLTICSWCFSLAPFISLATSLANSAAAS